MRRAALLLGLVVALAAAPAAFGADCPRTSLGDVEDEVMCPVCGTPLNLAVEAPQAERERAFIQSLIDRCRSKDQIKRALVAQYGDRVLALPGDEGTDLGDVLVYVIPGLGVLLGGAAVAVGASRWRRRRRRPAAGAAAGAGNERLDADMERYDL